MVDQLELSLEEKRAKLTYVRLTDTETIIIRLMCQGVTPKEIGGRYPKYKQARKTVHYFLRRIKDKLGARTTYQACAIYGSLHPNLDYSTHSSVSGTGHMSGKRSGELK